MRSFLLLYFLTETGLFGQAFRDITSVRGGVGEGGRRQQPGAIIVSAPVSTHSGQELTGADTNLAICATKTTNI